MNLFEGARLDGFPTLRSLPWQEDYLSALHAASGVLRATDRMSHALVEWLCQLSREEEQIIAHQSFDKSTHHKILLGGESGKYSVWLHRYKSPEEFDRSERFANSVHNHRYGFSSLVLTGKLSVVNYAVDVTENGDGRKVRQSDARMMVAGDTMILSANDVHRVDSVGVKTQTLLVQGPIVRHYSIRYNADGSAERIYDFEALIPALKSDILPT